MVIIHENAKKYFESIDCVRIQSLELIIVDICNMRLGDLLQGTSYMVDYERLLHSALWI